MHPRTLVILIVLILIGGVALRFLTVRYGWLPVSEEVVLKRSVAISCSYNVNGRLQTKTLTIDNPSEVRELLATLRIQRDDEWRCGFGIGPRVYHQVTFHFPNGQSRSQPLEAETVLGNLAVDRAFYDKLCEILSRHEGQRVDPLETPPQVLPQPDNNPDGIDR